MISTHITRIIVGVSEAKATRERKKPLVSVRFFVIAGNMNLGRISAEVQASERGKYWIPLGALTIDKDAALAEEKA